MKKMALLLSLPLTAGLLVAQSAADPISGGIKGTYNSIKNNLLKSADKMTEENYAFKPTPEVRSYGQLVGHLADAQYLFCSAVLGEKNPAPGIEKSKTSKADLVQALKDGEMVKFFGREMAKVPVLALNNAHNNEHYGNIVTYLRIKGLVPPSSEGRK